MKNLKNWILKLNEPYPFSRGFINELFSALRVVTLLSLLLFVIRPFGLEELSWYISFAFGLTALLAFLFNSFCTHVIFPVWISPNHWTVAKEIARTLYFLVVIAISLFMFANSVLFFDLNIWLFAKFLFYTVIIAIIPISVRVVLLKNQILKARLLEADALNHDLSQKSDVPEKVELKKIRIKSNVVNETFETTLEDLLYLAASQNYIYIVEQNHNGPKKHLFRISLVNALEQIRSDSVIRCHRSYAVNINKVEKVSGNAHGLKLKLKNSQELVPVSRSFQKELKAKLGQ